MRKTDHAGYTLIEAIIVLAIAGLLIAGVWIYSSSSINTARKNKLSEQVIQIIGNARNTLQNASDTSGLDVSSALAAGIIPSDMARSSTTASHNFNGDVTISGSSGSSNALLSLSDVPGDACIDLISGRLAATADAATQLGIATIKIGSSIITNDPSNGFGTAAGNTTIANACGDNLATIVITFAIN